MGRPLNKKYFANTNYAKFGTAGVGGESVASVTVVTGNSALYDADDVVAFSAPQISGGAAATGTIVVNGGGAVTGITVVTAGSGYTSAPTVTITTSTGTQTTLTLTAVLTSGAAARQNGLKCEAQVGAGSEVTTGDVIKQVSTRRYKVQTSDGTAVCKLVATADLNANEMSITATDANSNAYFVTKLTAHKATLTRKVSGDGDFATGAAVKWTFGSAAAGVVSIQNQ